MIRPVQFRWFYSSKILLYQQCILKSYTDLYRYNIKYKMNLNQLWVSWADKSLFGCLSMIYGQVHFTTVAMALWSCVQQSDTFRSCPGNTSVLKSTDKPPKIEQRTIPVKMSDYLKPQPNDIVICFTYKDISFLPMVKLNPSMLKVALLPLVKPFFLESVSVIFALFISVFCELLQTDHIQKKSRRFRVELSTPVVRLLTVISDKTHCFLSYHHSNPCLSHCLIIFSHRMWVPSQQSTYSSVPIDNI